MWLYTDAIHEKRRITSTFLLSRWCEFIISPLIRYFSESTPTPSFPVEISSRCFVPGDPIDERANEGGTFYSGLEMNAGVSGGVSF